MKNEIVKAFKNSKIKRIGDQDYDPMFDFYKLPTGGHVNRAGLTLQETIDLRNEHPKHYHTLRGKLIASMLRADPRYNKKAKPIYIAENDELAAIEALKDMEEEGF